MKYSYNLDEQVLSAALDVFAHAALLWFLFVAALSITDGDFTLVGGRGVLVADGALGHAQLALESRRLLHGGAHSAAGTSFDESLRHGGRTRIRDVGPVRLVRLYFKGCLCRGTTGIRGSNLIVLHALRFHQGHMHE